MKRIFYGRIGITRRRFGSGARRYKLLMAALFLGYLLVMGLKATCQVETEEERMEQYLEQWAEREGGEGMEGAEDAEDALRQLAAFREHPLNINVAGEADLRLLPVLSALHIDHFLRYRQLFGPLTDLHELQAIPLWDTHTIRLVLPYITIQPAETITVAARQLKGGESSLLFRVTEVPEKAKGYRKKDDNAAQYAGSPQKLYLRYRYNYRGLLRYGISGEKDAGEMFFRGRQRYGFDSYSFHLFLKNKGTLRSLALGDYTVCLGQGLIHWQGMSASRGAEALNVVQQAPVLKPYTAAGEYNFCRGAAVLLGRNNWEGMAFFSKRRLDGTLAPTPEGTVVSSINTSGNHRTATETGKKGNTGLLTMGYQVKYQGKGWSASGYLVHYSYSGRIEKNALPYNLFAEKGKRITCAGIDYHYTFRNIHFFGETAVDKQLDLATINGILISAHSCLDLSAVFRNISPSYHAPYGNAFTENSKPENERGIYFGMVFRINKYLRLTGYCDRYHFPWLKYRTDAPSSGSTCFLQAVYTPDKETELYIRYRHKIRETNDAGDETVRAVRGQPARNLRLQIARQLLPGLTVRNRVEGIEYDKGGTGAETGFLWQTDLIYKPLQRSWSVNGRIAFFDTDGYNSRIYAYENDVLYGAGFHALFEKGTRYYINIRKKCGLTGWRHWKNIAVSLRWAQTIFAEAGTGSGLDEIPGRRKSEIKIQLLIR